MKRFKIQKTEFKIQDSRFKKKTARIFGVFFIGVFCVLSIVPVISIAHAASPIVDPDSDPTKESFKLVACDGPTLPTNDAGKKMKAEIESKFNPPRSYVACDFNGIMLQVQHLINIMMVIGVFCAIFGFSFAGYLYITGTQSNIKRAHEIFPKVFFGFIIMLSAWFIVYQILTWLTDNPGFKTLLGNP